MKHSKSIVAAAWVLSVSVLSACQTSTLAESSEGGMFRCDPARSGVSACRGLPELKGLRWKFKSQGAVHSSPVIWDDRVIFGSDDGKLYALALSDGSVKWSMQTLGWIRSSPAVVDGTVYAGSMDGGLYAIDALAGKVMWKYQLADEDGWIFSSPVVSNGRVYFTSRKGWICALNTRNGKVAWRFRAQPEMNEPFSVAVAEGKVVFLTLTDRAYFLDEATGEQICLLKLANSPTLGSCPAIRKGTVYFGAGFYLLAYRLEDGALYWTVQTPHLISASSAVSNHTAYVPGAGLTAIDLRTRKIRWRTDMRAPVVSAPVVAGGLVYFGGHDGVVYSVSEQTGAVKWKFEVGSRMTSPAIGDGTIIFGSVDGSVYALE